MAYVTSDIITWAKAAQPLSLIGEYKKRAQTASNIDTDLHMKIYVERKSLEWQYAQDPSDSDGILFQQGNYVYALLFPYIFAAQQATGGSGQIVTPTSGVSPIESPIQIRGDDFASALSWQGTNTANVNVLSNYTIQVFYNPSSIFLTEGTDWTRTATGFDIVLGGVFSAFDATSTNDSDIFMIFISV